MMYCKESEMAIAHLSQPCWKRSLLSWMASFFMTFLTTLPTYLCRHSGDQSHGRGRSTCQDSSARL